MKLAQISVLVLLGNITCWCPPNFHHYGRLCLIFASHSRKHNYSEAVQDCNQHKAKLPVIDSNVDFYDIYLFFVSRVTSYRDHIEVGFWISKFSPTSHKGSNATNCHKVCTRLNCLKSIAKNRIPESILNPVDCGEKLPVVCYVFQQIGIASNCRFEKFKHKSIPSEELDELYHLLDTTQSSDEAEAMQYCSTVGCNVMALKTDATSPDENNETSFASYYYHTTNLYAGAQMLISGNSTEVYVPKCDDISHMVPPISVDKEIARKALLICLRNSSRCGHRTSTSNRNKPNNQYRAHIYQLKQWFYRAAGLTAVRIVADDGEWISRETLSVDKIKTYTEELKKMTGFYTVNSHIREKRSFIENDTFQYETPITYSFDKVKYTHKFTEWQRNFIVRVIKRLEEISCLKFKQNALADADLLIYRSRRKTDTCAAAGGKAETKSRGVYRHQGHLDIPTCVKMEKDLKGTNRTVKHELLHALGFEHEHKRYDRNKYIRIFPERIHPDFLDQFLIHTKPRYSNYGTGYDFASIMHYKCDGFLLSKYKMTSKACTMEPLPNYKGKKFGSNVLTSDDIKALNAKFCRKCTSPTMTPNATFHSIVFGINHIHASYAFGECPAGSVPSKMTDKLFTNNDRLRSDKARTLSPLKNYFILKCNAYENKWIPENIECVKSDCHFPQISNHAEQWIEHDHTSGKTKYTLICLPNFYKITGGSTTGMTRPNAATAECNIATQTWELEPHCEEIPVNDIRNINYERANYSGFAGILSSFLAVFTGALVAIYVLLIVKP